MMLILQSSIREPTGLAFSPDGESLLAVGGETIQVWPRWLVARPRRAKRVQASLERYAFSSDGTRVYLYVSGSSCTRVFDVGAGVESATALPASGPTWFCFTPEGGYFLSSYDRGTLTRTNYTPEREDRVCEAWSIKRPYTEEAKPVDKEPDNPTAIGSHYRFGAICGPAGTFVTMEYLYGSGEPLVGLTVRSTADGTLIHRQKLPDSEGRMLLADAGLALAVHPSGAYFAYPRPSHVRLWPLRKKVKIPDELPMASGAECRAVAFHPSGALLAVADGPAVLLYDTATWEVTRRLEWEIGSLRAVCFAPDGTRAAAIGAGVRGKKTGGRIVVWDLDV
jgi:WD40 repeat protein